MHYQYYLLDENDSKLANVCEIDDYTFVYEADIVDTIINDILEKAKHSDNYSDYLENICIALYGSENYRDMWVEEVDTSSEEESQIYYISECFYDWLDLINKDEDFPFGEKSLEQYGYSLIKIKTEQ